MWAIKDGDYYLSNKYEVAAEQLLGYGGVWAKFDIKQFRTKKEATYELRLMRIYGCGRKAEVVKLLEKR